MPKRYAARIHCKLRPRLRPPSPVSCPPPPPPGPRLLPPAPCPCSRQTFPRRGGALRDAPERVSSPVA